MVKSATGVFARIEMMSIVYENKQMVWLLTSEIGWYPTSRVEQAKIVLERCREV